MGTYALAVCDLAPGLPGDLDRNQICRLLYGDLGYDVSQDSITRNSDGLMLSSVEPMDRDLYRRLTAKLNGEIARWRTRFRRL